MIGTNRKNKLFQCLAIYALGSSTPMANTPIARTTRVNSNVIALTVSSDPPPHDRGLKMLPPYGPMMMPKMKARGASPMYSYPQIVS